MNRKLCIVVVCGRLVSPKFGAECRKCRRKRIHAGLKRLLRVKRGTAPDGVKEKRH